MKQKQKVILIFTVLFLFGSLLTNSMDARAETLASTIVNETFDLYVGKLKYVKGGTSLTTGVDCSGFVCAIFEKYGYNLWGNRTSLRNLPSSIATNIGTNINNALPGDIICTSGHVGIYAGDGLLINAANETDNVVRKKCSYYGSVVAIMRVKGVVQQLTPTPTPDTKPVISNITVKDVDYTGYTVQCTVTDSKGINRVQFPSWTTINDQDDIFSDWGSSSAARGTKNGDVYTYRVNASQHNYEEGWYRTHIYAYSNSGTETCAWVADVYIDRTKPQISNVKITNINSDGYTVQCTVTDNYAVDRVQFPTWTVNNGHDDLLADWGSNVKARGSKNGNTYTFQVKASEHNDEKSEYQTHVYAYDSCGNSVSVAAPNVNIWGDLVNIGSDIVVTIKNDFSGLYLTNMDENVTTQKADFTQNQIWIMRRTADGNYEIFSRNTAKILERYNAGKTSGTNVRAASYTGGSNQKWRICDAGNGKYRLAAPDTTNQILDIDFASANAQIWTYADASKEQQTFVISTNLFEGKTPDSDTETSGNSNSAATDETPNETIPENTETPKAPSTPKTPSTSNTPSPSKTPSTSLTYGKKYKDSKGNTYVVKNIGVNSATLTLVQANKKSKQITIPANIRFCGMKCSVTVIGENAFKGCKNVTKVTLPTTITTIQKNAFSKNTKCRNVIIKSSKIKSIGKNSFKGLHKKAIITLPKKNYSSQQKKVQKGGIARTVKIEKAH